MAIVPLLIALMLFFWFIWFLGGENDSLHRINKVQHLHHLQEELVIAAMQQRIELEQAHPEWSSAQLDAAVNQYVNDMMAINNIHE
ncbi:MAG: hypothetical protein JXK04_01200 [Campylobacterales bacterium]|nr:hypothetical protein [Campylobacterales bacterium]